MENISPDELAIELLNQCLRGNDYSSELLQGLLRRALSEDESEARRASHAFFHIVIERLSDLFEPCLVDVYAALFSETIATAIPGLNEHDLVERFRRLRQVGPYRGPDPQRIFVLSRVTLGADAAITGVVLDGAKKRFPQAEIFFVGSAKNYALFSADPRIRHWDAPYGRSGSLRSRLSLLPLFQQQFADASTLVIDPDSRLSQLGLLPVCDESRHVFFDSRGYGEYENESLGELTERWMRETFEIDARAFLALPPADTAKADIAVSLGVGENPSKKLHADFERNLLRHLSQKATHIIVDRGSSAEEGARVDHAVEGLANVRTLTGAFDTFARVIQNASLYVGYDSAGQHIAAVSGVPLLCVFAGYPNRRFLARWKPWGLAAREVVAVERGTWQDTLQEVERRMNVLPISPIAL